MTVTLQCVLLIIDCFPVSFAMMMLSLTNMPLQDPLWKKEKNFILNEGIANPQVIEPEAHNVPFLCPD